MWGSCEAFWGLGGEARSVHVVGFAIVMAGEKELD